MAYSLEEAADRDGYRSEKTTLTGRRPRVYLAPFGELLCSCKRCSMFVVIPV